MDILNSIVKFAPMADRHNSNRSSIIVDFVADTPIPNADPPASFFALNFQAAMWTRIFGKSESYR